MNHETKLFIPLMLLLSSCMIGPKYQRPIVHIPKTFAENRSDNNSMTELKEWWKNFNNTTIISLVTRALEKNYDLKIAYEKIAQYRARYGLAGGTIMPQINFSGGLSTGGYSQTVDAYNATPSPTFSFLQTSFDTLWEIDFWGKARHTRNAALCDLQATIEDARSVQIMLLAEVVKNYILYCSTKHKANLITNLITVNQELAQLYTSRTEQGLDPAITLQEIKARHDSLAIEYEQLTIHHKEAMYLLGALLNQTQEATQAIPISPVLPQAYIPISSGLPSDLILRRPDIRKAERALASTTELVGQAKAYRFPSISLLGSIGLQSNHAEQWFSGKSVTWSLGPSLSLPVLSFGRITYQIKEKESVMKQALDEYCNCVVKSFADVEQSLAAYFGQQKQVGRATNKNIAFDKKITLLNDAFSAGLSNKIELLQAQYDAIQSQIDLANKQEAYAIAAIRLYKALGGGW